MEISFQLSKHYSDRYNKDSIVVFGEFISPSSDTIKQFGFYYKGYFTQQSYPYSPYNLETYARNNDSLWKIRIAPDEIGIWIYRIFAIDSESNFVSSVDTFTVISSNLSDVIKISTNNKYLTSGNNVVMPIGINANVKNPDGFWLGSISFGLNYYYDLIDRMKLNNMNILRLWIESARGLGIIGHDYQDDYTYGFSNYNQKDSWLIDSIVEYARMNNVNLLITIFSSHEWGDAADVGNQWTNYSPYNITHGGNIAKGFDFTTDSFTIAKQKDYIRYVISRWGYANNIIGWELWNEANQTLTFNNPSDTEKQYFMNTIGAWHDTMANYIRQVDASNHLVSTSLAGDKYTVSAFVSVFNSLDFSQGHFYQQLDVNLHTNKSYVELYSIGKNKYKITGKPFIAGELGYYTNNGNTNFSTYDPNGFQLHELLSASIFMNDLSIPLFWHTRDYLINNDLFYRFKGAGSFIKRIDFLKNLSTYSEENNSYISYYLADDNYDNIYGYLQDTNISFNNVNKTTAGRTFVTALDLNSKPYVDTINNTFNIPVNNLNYNYKVDWFSTYDGSYIESEIYTSDNNTLTISVLPTLLRDTFSDAFFIASKNILTSSDTICNRVKLRSDWTINSGEEVIVNSCCTIDACTYKVIIEPGGKLIIDGGKITSSCGLWKGIQVKGNHSLSQNPESNQGVLYIRDSAIIENAEIAVAVNNGNEYNPVLQFYGGGIIKTHTAIFKNNETDIQMSYYADTVSSGVGVVSKKQRSIIYNTKFLTDTNHINGFNKEVNISLFGVFGLNIKGNLFENTANNQDVISKGIGITSNNSSFNLIPYPDPQCPTCTPKPNTFKNLHYGIQVFNGLNSSDIIQINNNSFDNVYRAISLSGTSNAEVLQNDIKACDMLPSQSGQPSPGAPFGIYLNGGDGFKIEENTIYRPSSNGYAQFNGSRGIVVHKTGADNNEIYKNTLNNLAISNQAQCYNAGYGNMSDVGLKYFCNTSQTSTYSYDFWVGGQNYCSPQTVILPGNYRFGIAEHQQNSVFDNNLNAYVTAPAANQFSDSHSSLPLNGANDFDNGEAEWIEYSWNTYSTNGRYKPDKKDNVSLHPMSVTFDVCPSKIQSGGSSTYTVLYNDFHTAKIAYNSSYTLLNIWKNGGDANLDYEVETTSPWDAYTQFNDLLAESPYLDEAVLIEFINNPVFSSLMVKLLIIANPHAIDNAAVMDALYERNPPLPDAYLAEIESQPESSSQLSALKANVSADYHLMSYISDRIITKYKTDTINEFAKDSLINFVSRKRELADKYELATIYLSYGQYDNMTTLLNNIEQNFEMSDEMISDFSNYKTVLNIAKNIQQEDLFVGSLSDLQRDSLLNIYYNDRPQVSAMALAILKRDNPEFQYSEIIYNIGEEAPMANPYNSGNIRQENSFEYAEFMLYPNPTIDYTTLRYNANYNNLSYIITDIKGGLIVQKKLETIENSEYHEVLIDLRQLAPGTYYLRVKTNNSDLFNSKLVITK